jgi:hypothetical protein
VGCARNDKTECGTGNKAFLIHSGFDLQSSRRYVQYFQQPFCNHVLNIYKVNYFSNSGTLVKQRGCRSALRCSVLTLRGGAANPQSALGSGIPEESSLQRLHHDTTPAPTAL